MDQPIVRDFASKPSVTSTQLDFQEDTTPGRYTCYDTNTFLALYIILATTSTLDAASQAFEQGEKLLKAHRKIEITDAHAALARHPSSNLGRTGSGEQAGEEGNGRIRSRFWSKVMKLVHSLKVE